MKRQPLEQRGVFLVEGELELLILGLLLGEAVGLAGGRTVVASPTRGPRARAERGRRFRAAPSRRGGRAIPEGGRSRRWRVRWCWP